MGSPATAVHIPAPPAAPAKGLRPRDGLSSSSIRGSAPIAMLKHIRIIILRGWAGEACVCG